MPEYKIVKYAYESDEDGLKYSVDDIDGTEEAILEENKGPVAAIKLASLLMVNV